MNAGALTDRPVATRSLRVRVAGWVLGLLLVVLVGLGVVVNLVLDKRLQSELDQRLRDRAGLAQALATQGLSAQQLTDRLTGAGITATIGNGSNAVTGRDLPPPGRPYAPGAGPQRGPRPAASSRVTIQRTGERLTASVDTDEGNLTLSTSRADIDHTLATLRTIELAAGAATLVITALVLFRVVGLALAPLDRMTGLARRIRDGTRGRRLQPTRPGTELGRTAAAFDDMLDALESAEAQAQSAEARMRTFLADASHDLRTPIAGVIATAERILHTETSRRGREQHLVALIREAHRAGRLVDDLLLMARLDDAGTQPVQLTPLDLGAIARAAVERSGALLPARSVAAVVPRDRPVTDGPMSEELTVLADSDGLDRILGNLLDNARAATRPDDSITVTVSSAPDEVVLEVADTGRGVAGADQERIFERFVRVDDSRADRGGRSGLGLPIARTLARSYGGELTSVPSADGAVFRLTLPRARSYRSIRRSSAVVQSTAQ